MWETCPFSSFLPSPIPPDSNSLEEGEKDILYTPGTLPHNYPSDPQILYLT